MSPALSFLTCSAFTADDDDDFDFYNSSIASSLDRRDGKRLKFRSKKPKSTTLMTISTPTNFRHDIHLGSEVKADGTFALWDADRWRLELAKKDLILPPLSISQQPSANTSSTLSESKATSTASKRNSFTPQKRKPVPSLLPPERSKLRPLPPHSIPLPPSPSLTPTDSGSDLFDHATDFEGSEVPPLDPPSRGPSIDESDEVLSLKRDDEKLPSSQWEYHPALKEADRTDPGIGHESALLQT